MNVFKRFWNYITALLQGKLDKWEDPEIILNQAVREMKENQAKNRELAVQAITQKNNLQAEVDKEERLVADLDRKAVLALQSGNRELAKQFLKEKAMHEQILESLRQNLAAATEAAEKVKIAIKTEEERIRVRTAEALALKSQLKQAQIQNKIHKALDQFQFTETEGQWQAAKERITSLESEARARQEVNSTSIDAKLRELEVSQMDAAAEQELAELERRMANPASNYANVNNQQLQTLGGGTVNANGSAANSMPESDIDRQLRELEERLSKQ
jgi:phage shock protein A